MKIDLNYYKTVVATQRDAEILRSELQDLIAEIKAQSPPEPVLCDNPSGSDYPKHASVLNNRVDTWWEKETMINQIEPPIY